METTEKTIKEVLKELRDLGYTHAKVTYSGGGDSGCIEATDFFMKDDDVDSEKVHDTDYKETYKILQERRRSLQNQAKAIENAIDPVLTRIEDWWNNDGGRGYVTIDLNTGKYEIENIVYYTESNTYNHSGEL